MAFAKYTEEERFTYSDYLAWDDELRWELIDGVPFCMSPAPGQQHQEILLSLVRQFADYLDGKSCSAFIAPFDVCLSERVKAADDEITTVVQPDMMVVCDSKKLDGRGVKGAPDIAVEIISPSTAKRDITTKYDLYQHHGVKEYWLIYPKDRTLLVYRLSDDGKYATAEVFGECDQVPVPLLGELVIDLTRVFKMKPE